MSIWKKQAFNGNSQEKSPLRIQWRLSTNLKQAAKVYKVTFFIYKSMNMLEVYSLHYILRWNKNFKKFTSDKINFSKTALFFLLLAPAHHSFTFNLRFLYELKHKVRLSKTVCEILHFQFCFIFIKVLLRLFEFKKSYFLLKSK